MDAAPDLLTRVLEQLLPALADAVAGRSERLLIWVAVDPATDRCAIRFLTPASVILAELAGELPRGETNRLASCYPALALPLIVTSPTRLRRSWLQLHHQPRPISPN
ncbi:MAG: hypothetical protein RMM58_13895 [Chloroflexota bacterium]|nr:hypothetical protein [Dehalococcoidia bacterium]MDW8254964.1 hypothetical protein [Chloroflexota bacterium]